MITMFLSYNFMDQLSLGGLPYKEDGGGGCLSYLYMYLLGVKKCVMYLLGCSVSKDPRQELSTYLLCQFRCCVRVGIS